MEIKTFKNGLSVNFDQLCTWWLNALEEQLLKIYENITDRWHYVTCLFSSREKHTAWAAGTKVLNCDDLKMYLLHRGLFIFIFHLILFINDVKAEERFLNTDIYSESDDFIGILKSSSLHAYWKANVNVLQDEFNLINKCPDCSHQRHCRDIVKLLGVYAAEFISCAVSNARPITMCSNCVEPYLIFGSVYDDILKVNLNFQSITKCV